MYKVKIFFEVVNKDDWTMFKKKKNTFFLKISRLIQCIVTKS